MGITPYQGLDQVDIVSPDICKDNSGNGSTKCRSFCATPVTSIPQYMSWKLDPCCMYGNGCLATKMNAYIALCFSPIFSNRESFKEKPRGQSYCDSHYFNMVVANLLLLKMSIKSPILLPAKNTLLMNPPWSTHPLLELGSLRLVAWLISSNEWRQREYLKRLQSSSQLPKGQVNKLVTNQPGISGLADLHRDKLSLFDAL